MDVIGYDLRISYLMLEIILHFETTSKHNFTKTAFSGYVKISALKMKKLQFFKVPVVFLILQFLRLGVWIKSLVFFEPLP